MYQRLIPPLRWHQQVAEGLLEATERDRARIVQAAPVRRLQQKTQVFPLDVQASVRSRLTHSLEVQETGRRIVLAILARLPDPGVPPMTLLSLVEMSCLLHDVGNPPFGHFGEQVIGAWCRQQLPALYPQAQGRAMGAAWEPFFTDLCHFDGNAQSLRLVHHLHELDLTLGQLAALCKYPGGAEAQGWRAKRGVYLSEAPVMEEVARRLGLAPGSRHPLVYIMEAADDVSYCIADLEDAVDRRLLSHVELLAALHEAQPDNYMATLIAQAEQSRDGFFPAFRFALERDLVALAAQTYLAHHDAILAGSHDEPLLHGQSPAALALETLRQVARRHVFKRREVESLELEGFAALRGILGTYATLLALPGAEFQAVLEGNGGPSSFLARRLCHRLSARHVRAYRRALARPDARFADLHDQEWYYRVRLLIDYVSGMTDTYALAEYRLLSAGA